MLREDWGLTGHTCMRFDPPLVLLLQVRSLMGEFAAAIEAGTHAQQGWPNSMYGVSKLGEATFSRVLARREPEVTVSACCPGWCATDMSSHSGPRSAAQGADTAVWLALAEEMRGGSGSFWSDRREEGF
jgi:carbonyl reductase 1